MEKQIKCPAIEPATQACDGSCDGCYHPDELPPDWGKLSNKPPEAVPSGLDEPSAAYHRHLDICEQCREHVFEPCLLGAVLLRRAVGC